MGILGNLKKKAAFAAQKPWLSGQGYRRNAPRSYKQFFVVLAKADKRLTKPGGQRAEDAYN
jgi:hypothetical protein